MSAVLHREAFRTSRLLEFCSAKELTAQTGHQTSAWPLCILKEVVDNALDACEEADIAPEIHVEVSTSLGVIMVTDNGPGLPAETVADVLDYSVRVSSREAYASPTRGAQGNALKTILAMPFALQGRRGEVLIEAQGVAHFISFAVDQLRQEPKIDHSVGTSFVTTGTRAAIMWPISASSILTAAKSRFLQIADDFAWLNPHASIRVEWDGVVCVDQTASDPAWRKWRACDPTSAHWYDVERLERYAAAHVSRDQDHGRDRMVREFVAEFRGYAGSAKQKLVLDQTGLARAPLSSLFGSNGEPKRAETESLLAALRQHSRPVKAADLGLIGRNHLLGLFVKNGASEQTFSYQKVLGMDRDYMPWVVETAFGYCPKKIDSRRLIVGVNWSVGLGNPFRSFSGGEGLESLLAEQRAGRDEPIVFVLHFACPRINFTDRGKTAIAFTGDRP
jgi:DNA topoisomerase VI subunit B